jgi:hypothetical protein
MPLAMRSIILAAGVVDRGKENLGSSDAGCQLANVLRIRCDVASILLFTNIPNRMPA